MLTPNYFTEKCFSHMAEIKLEKSKKPARIEDLIIKKHGINVTWFGNTDSTFKESNCNQETLKDLLPFGHGRLAKTKNYRDWLEAYEFMGYTPGLTMQALPFDWRFDPVWQSVFHKKFKLVAKRLKNLTGKKSALVAHSNGNILTYYSLEMFWTKEEKSSLLNNYISISPPYMGLIMIIRFLLGGTDWLTKGPFGFGYEAGLKITAKAPVMLQSLVTPIYNRENSKEFLELIGQHLKYEKSFTRQGDTLVQGMGANGVSLKKGIEFWPSPKEICSKFINFNDTDYCTSALFDPLGLELVKIKEAGYKYEDIKALLRKESYLSQFENAWSYYDTPEHSRLELETPPTGIPLIMVYTSVLPTENEVYYTSHPYKISSADSRPYYPDSQTYKRGDGRITSSSSLLTTLKWAHQFSAKKVGAPVKFVELCSVHNNKVSPFDHKFVSHFANSDYIRDKRPGINGKIFLDHAFFFWLE